MTTEGDAMVSFRLPVGARDRVTERARHAGVNRSEWLRAVVLRALADDLGEMLEHLPPELTDEELRRLLTRQALGGSVQAAKALLELRRPADDDPGEPEEPSHFDEIDATTVDQFAVQRERRRRTDP